MDDKQQIIRIYRQENQAMVEKDLPILEKILSDDMHLIHMTGYDQSKKEWLEQIKNEQMCYFSSEEESIHDLKIEGNKASFIGQNKVDARIYGSRNIWNLEMNMMFEKKAGAWLIVRQEASTY
ncbi:nuclear transport factor 2 family protein [Enterococcus plantarum]|uniref:nuclear transport factor 2 family protein n=1 Tax=Enterococcus plantarum TaxID=1077675 RepID=UPI001A8F93CF|nr:nuclear transport factor 2 family protein [Enterococcus plantarum]MBO0422794.1 nuclear transport factor 2 family protein [Enterococcus plantarum]